MFYNRIHDHYYFLCFQCPTIMPQLTPTFKLLTTGAQSTTTIAMNFDDRMISQYTKKITSRKKKQICLK